jgi:periplasmic copper chaperone A
MFHVAEITASNKRVRLLAGLSVLLAFCMPPAFGAGNEALQLSNASVPPSDKTGADLPLSMTINNQASDPDALLRVRCPVVNFNERHIVDRGEGAPAMRSIPSIPIPAGKTIELRPDQYHVMLLQTRQKLAEGDTFTCAIVFQKAGTIETEVHVKR